MKYLNNQKARLVVGILLLVLLVIATQDLFNPSISEGIAIRNPLWGSIYNADVASAVSDIATATSPSPESP